MLADCDVEEPNCRIFTGGVLASSSEVSTAVPVVDERLCASCGECSRFCRYHAIVCLGKPPVVFPELCHGCGGCTLVCPAGAITEAGRRTGVVEVYDAGGLTLVEGRLDVGSAMGVPVIRAVLGALPPDGTAIIDAPPGTACPMVASVSVADAVVLVTEPTPFGLHDLSLAVETLRLMGLPFGVVVNRAGSGDGRVHDFCSSGSIPLLAEIPDDRRIAEAYSRGVAAIDAVPGTRPLFEAILSGAAGLAAGGGP